jgi:hypothetical protein
MLSTSVTLHSFAGAGEMAPVNAKTAESISVVVTLNDFFKLSRLVINVFGKASIEDLRFY